MKVVAQQVVAEPVSRECSEVGNELYRRVIQKSLPAHRESMVTEWSPTPWMLDVVTEGREHEIRDWCYTRFGPSSSPMHGRSGAWRRSWVTLHGRSWFGFQNREMLEQFAVQFPAPGHG